MERIIRKKLLQHLEENNLLSPSQHGFVSKKSCLTNLLESLEDWTDIIDRGGAADVIYLDFSKAFDTVPHRRLMKKLHCYGIQGKVHGWLEDFLTGRQQMVTIGSSESFWGRLSAACLRVRFLDQSYFCCTLMTCQMELEAA